jgi:uncharacterized protein YbjT (DUF2867 family)
MLPSLQILVTCATRFVGCHIVSELLAHGHQVHAVSRDRMKTKLMP